MEMSCGGKTIVVGGDFRQVLPVIEKGRQEVMANACVKQSLLWQHFVTYHLSTDMRATPLVLWARMLLEIGEGKYQENENVELPPTFSSTVDLISDISGGVTTVDNITHLAEKAIPAPRNIHVAQWHPDLLSTIVVSMFLDADLLSEAEKVDVKKSKYFLIPRTGNYTNKGLPFPLCRRQFPVRLDFVITISKA
ncbi:hypothetical protein TELCIR_13012 [Teladorsagia circumcincta]|uniref:ATP-dependent DNA helicase n=1 Tax=Teladorsagia circumcincta TaxID=45464 RepID=A0A2G9U4X1_TELCI|nr:hypothetical protein TELCIR_13012 [Teladorsagia circumcincta]